MKKLTFADELVEAILSGRKTETWRVNDEKGIQSGDIIACYARPHGNLFGYVQVQQVSVKTFRELESSNSHEHEQYANAEEMYAVYRSYYGKDIGTETSVKVVSFMLLEKEVALRLDAAKKAIVHTDGGSRGNPGPSAAGYIIETPEGDFLARGGEYLGVTTNNQAEYLAVREALERCKELGVSEIAFFCDSMLVVNQMNGSFQIKNRDLWPVHTAIKQLIDTFHRVTFTHVPREQNVAADHEVNVLLDQHRDTTRS
jgi:ribonuclease HI